MSLMNPDKVESFKITPISITVTFKEKLDNGCTGQVVYMETQKFMKCKTYEELYKQYQGGAW